MRRVLLGWTAVVMLSGLRPAGAGYTEILDSPDALDERNLVGTNPYPGNPGTSLLQLLYGEKNLHRVNDSLDQLWYYPGGGAASVSTVAGYNRTPVECGFFGSSGVGPFESLLTLSAYSPDLILGDVDTDGAVTMRDGIDVLDYLFASGDPLASECAADVNGDAALNLADPVTILERLFGSPPDEFWTDAPDWHAYCPLRQQSAPLGASQTGTLFALGYRSDAGTFSSRQQDNPRRVDHMVTYEIVGDVGHPGNVVGSYVVAWEGGLAGGDRDYQDTVLELHGVAPVPEPSALVLVATGAAVLLGLAWRGRKPRTPGRFLR